VALFTLTGLNAGCLDEHPGHDAATTQQPLVGGTISSLRPEIGQINGGSCTATLIGPQLVVTAAHCARDAPTGSFAVAGHGFTYSYDHTRTWQGSEVSGLYNADVAILHLTTAVPSSVATPATLSVNVPVNGTRATTFGYGCTDRNTMAGAGTKRFFQFTVGPSPDTLCYGDSGGPVVLGNAGDGGLIYAINSAFGVDLPSGLGDVFGDVATHKIQIEDVLHGWNGQLEQGFDRIGTNGAYRSLATASPQVCSDACKRDAACRSFAWTPDQCWLQNDAPELVSHPGFVSGLPPPFETATDRSGSDYTNFVPSAAMPELCASACQIDAAMCKAWTYDAPVGTAPAHCWLKNAVPAATAAATAISGVANRLLEVGYDRPGGDYWHGPGFSFAAQCAQKCAADKACRSFSWTSTTNTCWLKNTVPQASAGPISVAGVKRGVEVDVDRAGANISSFASTDPSPFACQAACAGNLGCKAWTYVRPVTGSRDYTCYIKSGIAPAVASPDRGLVSGIKGLEFLPAPSH
jgi:hypothetical protein